MKNFKTIRNIWIFTGICFLLSILLNLSSNGPSIVRSLEGITCILSFIIAYNFHRKISKDNKK